MFFTLPFLYDYLKVVVCCIIVLNSYLCQNKDLEIKAYAFSSGSKRCDLCITEKLTILLTNPRQNLTQRTELLSKCSHKRAF